MNRSLWWLLGALTVPAAIAAAAEGDLEISQACAAGAGCFTGDTPGRASPRRYVLEARLRSTALLICLALRASLAGASDGVFEINQACATGPGCFAGDTPGFPVDLAANGSFRLTSNLLVPDENTTAIRLLGDFITLDLGGHQIRGVTVCAGTTPVGCVPLGSGRAIDAVSTIDHVTVRNGTLRGMGSSGLVLGPNCTVEEVRATGNGASGIQVGAGCVITRSQANRNGATGISAGNGSTLVDNAAHQNTIGLACADGCVLRGNVARDNAADGISVSDGCSLTGNSSIDNFEDGIDAANGATLIGNAAYQNGDATSSTTDDGIECGAGCRVEQNSVRQNSGVGLRLSTDSAYRGNTVTANITDGVLGGVNNGENHCAGTGVSAPACP